MLQVEKVINKKIFFLTFFLVLISLTMFGNIESVNAHNSYLDGWIYRKSHIVNSATGAGTNYQIKLTVYYGSGSDSGGSVYLSSLCKTDFGDVRFTDDDGHTLLDYWIESYTSSSLSIFWVEIADSLESSNVVIYIYYGNSGVSSVSNSANTLLFFDDFSGTLGAWTMRSGTWTIVTGNLKSTSNDGDQIVTASFTGQNIRFRLRGETILGSGNAGLDIIMRTADANNLYRAEYWNSISGTDYWDGGKRVASSWSGFTSSSGPVVITGDQNYHLMEMDWSNSSGKAVLDDSAVLWTATDASLTGNRAVGFRYGGSGSYFSVDWCFVSKYVSPEPVNSSWGIQEGLLKYYTFNYTSGGLFYYNTTYSIPTSVIKVTNGSVISIPIGYSFVLFGLPNAGKVFTKFILNATDNTSANPLKTSAILGNGTIWCYFGTAPIPDYTNYYPKLDINSIMLIILILIIISIVILILLTRK